jgi:hypothetical protein
MAETASSESGGDKAAWIRAMFATTAFPRLEAIVWFNEDKETDWRIESSPARCDAFASALGRSDDPGPGAALTAEPPPSVGRERPGRQADHLARFVVQPLDHPLVERGVVDPPALGQVAVWR